MQLKQKGAITIPTKLSVGEKAYITTLQVNQWSYLKKTNISGACTVNHINFHTFYQTSAWVSCLARIAGSDVSVVNQLGRQVASAFFTSNLFNMTWTQPHPNGMFYKAQYSLYGSVGMIYQAVDSSDVTGMSIITTSYNGAAHPKDFY